MTTNATPTWFTNEADIPAVATGDLWLDIRGPRGGFIAGRFVEDAGITPDIPAEYAVPGATAAIYTASGAFVNEVELL